MDSHERPIIFLAFANEQDDTIAYLRQLPEEARGLRDVLEPLVDKGLCEIVERTNSTADEIFKVFQSARYRNRVAIFHYGGHANGYQLLLESSSGKAAAADAGGLAAFLGQQHGLRLVFLNGCSTQQQTQGLLDANIPAVISTSRSINDQVATEFAIRFYEGLAGGATIRTAYNEAAAAVRTAKGGNTRELYLGSDGDFQTRLEADRWPWNLYIRQGSEQADQWNLPEAVGDPLFGLPPLPDQDLPDTPYRHLRWFTREHAQVFFGRGHEIRELYERITALRAAPIILFYGQSGVGKSSVLDAGLIPRLDGDYDVHYLRCTTGGLLDRLRLSFLPEDSGGGIESAWHVKEEQTGKPLILFLDQVEELFTRRLQGLPDELEQLLQVIGAWFRESERRPRGKLVLSFRKEWLAELETQLDAYELWRTKLFLRALDRRGIIEAVLGPAQNERLKQQYGLTIEDGLAEIIADDLLPDEASAIAPTLQILLTKMWNKATDPGCDRPVFSKELYHQLKRDGILLRDFLTQQIVKVRDRNREAVDSGLLLDILAAHTTPLGMADQRSVEELQRQYRHWGSNLPGLLQECENLYLLTVTTGTQKEFTKTTRLAHDTLAPLVRERFDESDKPGQRARRILDSRSADWEDDREGAPLDEMDLALVEQGANGTRASNSTEQRLLQASKAHREQERLNEVRRRRKLQRFRAIGTALATTVLIVSFIAVAFYLRQRFVTEQLGLRTSEYQTLQRDYSTLDSEYGQLQQKKSVLDREIEEKETKFCASYAPLYRTTMAVVQAAWENGEVLGARRLLEKVEPQRMAGNDFRGFEWSYWKGCCDGALQTFKGRDVACTSVAYDPKGEYVASGDEDGVVRLFDLSSGQSRILAEKRGDYGWQIQDLAFSPDGRKLAAAGESQDVTVWEVATGTPHSFKSNYKSCLAFSPNGEILAAGGFDGVVLVWNVETGERLIDLQKLHKGPVFDVAFDATGRRLASCAMAGLELIGSEKLEDSKNVIVLELSPGGLVEEFNAEPTRRVGFMEDGAKLITVDWDRSIRVMEISSGATLVTERRAKSLGVRGLALGPGHKLIATADKNGMIYVGNTGLDWELKVGFLASHSLMNNLAFSPDGRRIVSGADDGTVRVWDASRKLESRSYAARAALPNAIETAFSKDGSSLGYVSSLTGQCTVFDVSTAKVLRQFAGSDKFSPLYAAFSGDGKRVALTRYDSSSLELWDVGRGEQLLSVEYRTADDYIHCSALAVNANGTRVAAAIDRNIMVWDGDSGNRHLTLAGHHKGVSTVAFSPDGKHIVSGDFAHKLIVWNAMTGEAIRTIEAGDGALAKATFNPTGELVAAIVTPETVVLWRFESAEEVQRLRMSGHKPQCLAFAPDNSWLAVGYESGRIAMWDRASSDRTLVLKHPREDSVHSVAFSPNGLQVVGGCWGRTVSRDLSPASSVLEMWDASPSLAVASVDSRPIVTDGEDRFSCVLCRMMGKTWLLRPETPPWGHVASPEISFELADPDRWRDNHVGGPST